MKMPENPSNSFRRLNSSLYEQDIRVENPRSIAVLECFAGDGALAAVEAQEKDSGRFFIRVTSRRKRLLDEDNLAEKFHIDCCRYAGIIPSDAPERARIEVRQEKIRKDEAEETLIEVFQ